MTQNRDKKRAQFRIEPTRLIHKKPKTSLTFFVAVLLLLWGGEALAKTYIYKSRLTTLHYPDEDRLKIFADKIEDSVLTRTLNQIFLVGTVTASDERLGKVIDRLFQRVQMILDMPQPRLKIHIQIYQNQKELSEVYGMITGKPTELPAFYLKKTNTIYLHTEKLSTGILAHEMAHAVIDHYFIVGLPRKIAELLSQYVDRQISRGNF